MTGGNRGYFTKSTVTQFFRPQQFILRHEQRLAKKAVKYHARNRDFFELGPMQ